MWNVEMTVTCIEIRTKMGDVSHCSNLSNNVALEHPPDLPPAARHQGGAERPAAGKGHSRDMGR